ncbi:hypothetical protein Tco_0105469 [Tanacetum coccineum]
MLWVRVIKSIYGNQGGFDRDNPRVFGPQPWARILSLISRLKAKNVVRQDTLQRKIGDGTSTKFWHDCWLNGITLANQYTRLYSLETHKDCVVSEKWNSGDGWIWSWRRNVDSWNWNPNPSGDFTIKYTLRWLDDIILPMNLSMTRWNPLVPRKVTFFVGESSEIWEAIFAWLGSIPPDTVSINDLFLWIDNNHMVAKKKKGFEAISAFISRRVPKASWCDCQKRDKVCYLSLRESRLALHDLRLLPLSEVSSVVPLHQSPTKFSSVIPFVCSVAKAVRWRYPPKVKSSEFDSNSPIIEYHMNPKNICEDTPRSSRCALCRASEQSDTAATALQCRSPNVSSLQI